MPKIAAKKEIEYYWIVAKLYHNVENAFTFERC